MNQVQTAPREGFFFFWGGGGGGGGGFFCPQNYFTEGIQWFISRKTMIFQGREWGRVFQLLIPMETYRICDFPGGGGSNPVPIPFSGLAHV